VYTISIPAETTLEGLAERINEDDDNPGVTATVIDTGTGDNPYQLVLTADDSGEDNRITIISEPPGLTLTETNGSGYSMTGDAAISFDTDVTIDTTNNTIVFQEDTGDGYGDTLTAEIAVGDYETAEELAEAVELALENESSLNGEGKDYQVDIDEDTGEMTISEAGTLEGLNIMWEDASSTASATLGFSETQEITPASSSLNAEITVDGISYQRQENTSLSDIITGVTLSLYSTGVTTVSVSASTGTVEDAITSMVETYNTLMTEIDENDDYDEDTETWGTLAQSSTARILEQSLQSLFSTTVSTGGSITSLIDLGLEFEDDGTLTLDADTLSEQLLDNFDEIQDLLLGTDTETGLADILNDAIGNYALSDGYIDTEIDMIDEKISRLEDAYSDQLAIIDKKYETMATEYAALDSYLSELSSIQSYVETMFASLEDD
jgi:flagellar hook-associated protein 2